MPSPTPPEDHGHPGYEVRDFQLRVVLQLAIVIAGLIVFSMIGLWYLEYNSRTKAEVDRRDSPLADIDQTPPLPRLQSSPNLEYAVFLAQQEKQLDSYGWVDRKNDVMRIPIASAIDLALERGLPEKKPVTATPAEEEEK